ncbi:WhiB family transcriptional regulator [Streptomyces sp. NPDC093109]|uniref:WhiB family transcriptional regulator n=1 Tax=Streptomyces sp. NPDC093109 TaxID=3154977 RepID=UPI0034511068
MSHTTVPLHMLADPRIPFPSSATATACQPDPARFVHEYGAGADDRARIEQAKAACTACPLAVACLKWALANEKLTPTGIWAATTARQRTALRKTLVERLGPDWAGAGAVAARDRTREQRDRARRLNPPTVRDRALSALEHERIPTRPTPYEPWREPMTPARQAHNRRQLLAALTTKTAA